MENPPLASISLTHVQYDPSSHLSHASAYLALVPQVLMITYVTLIWSTREIEIALMFAGQLGCEGLNWMLKRYIREERPTQMLGKGYGMPSSHAQFVAFFAVYLSMWVLGRHDPWKRNESTTHMPTPFWQRLALAAVAMVGAAAVAQSRVYVSLHFTPPSVLVPGHHSASLFLRQDSTLTTPKLDTSNIIIRTRCTSGSAREQHVLWLGSLPRL
jgi:dolichyldiphosphatase